jgi:hypothetical protein
MELVWLIVLAIVLCTALLAITCGLMLAPWYVLLAALGMVLVVSQQWMAELRRDTPETTISEIKKNSAIAQTTSSAKPTQTGAMASLLESSHPTHLIYRGVDYIPSRNTASLATPPSGHLIYRGADYVLSQDREEHSVESIKTQ